MLRDPRASREAQQPGGLQAEAGPADQHVPRPVVQRLLARSHALRVDLHEADERGDPQLVVRIAGRPHGQAGPAGDDPLERRLPVDDRHPRADPAELVRHVDRADEVLGDRGVQEERTVTLDERQRMRLRPARERRPELDPEAPVRPGGVGDARVDGQAGDPVLEREEVGQLAVAQEARTNTGEGAEPLDLVAEPLPVEHGRAPRTAPPGTRAGRTGTARR